MNAWISLWIRDNSPQNCFKIDVHVFTDQGIHLCKIRLVVCITIISAFNAATSPLFELFFKWLPQPQQIFFLSSSEHNDIDNDTARQVSTCEIICLQSSKFSHPKTNRKGFIFQFYGSIISIVIKIIEDFLCCGWGMIREPFYIYFSSPFDGLRSPVLWMLGRSTLVKTKV